MTENLHGTIWVSANDLERLFTARRICYLVGSYDGSGNYGDILQLHANTERLRTAGDDLLAVSLVHWKRAADHAALTARHPWLFNDCCTLYYIAPDDLEDAGEVLDEQQLVIVPSAPPAFSQIIVYGGGFLNSWWGWGAHKMNLIALVTEWLDHVSTDVHPVAIIGQQISSNFLTGPDGDQLAALLGHAAIIGVRDELSLENLNRWNQNASITDAVISGDDATLPIIAARDRQDDRFHSPNGSRSGQLPVVNIHLSVEDYVTDQPHSLLKTFEKIVHRLRRAAGDGLTLNLLVAYDDSRITESRIVDQLKASSAASPCTVNVVSCIDEFHQGFPNIGRAQLTISCSYHVALTSLFLGIPTAFVHSNEYYWHKAEGLKRAFQLPDDLLFDARSSSLDSFASALERVFRDQSHRAQLSRRAAQGASSMLLRNATTSIALSKFLTARYVADRNDRYQTTARRLIDTTEQLSDLRLEYNRLLNTATSLSVATWERGRNERRATTDYGQTVQAIHKVVADKTPRGAQLLIVSKGDDELVDLNGRTGWHFPQTPAGAYAGHHPADSAAAMKHLKDLRAKGAEYLVFPNSAFWWLDHYGKLARHLDKQHRKIWSDQHCIIYQLSKAPVKPAQDQSKGRRWAGRAPAVKANGKGSSNMASDPIIVYGPPRSGTSYLIHILNKQPNVFITPETRVFVWAHRTLNEETHEFFSVFKHRERYIAYLKDKYPDLIRDYYRELNDKGAFYWGDKNPHYASPDSDGCLQTIVDLYPGARFINIIRDGRGNVASMMKKGWANFDNAHRSWIGHVETGCAFGRHLHREQYFELRYEDLIKDDTAMVRRICDFLQIEIHPSVVKFCDRQKHQRSPINWPERSLSGDLTKSDWDTILTPEEQLRSLRLLGRLLIEHGYETTESLREAHGRLLPATRPSLVTSVRDVVRDALPDSLPMVGNGSTRRMTLEKD